MWRTKLRELKEVRSDHNTATYYKTANILNFTELVKLDFCHIERCFKTVVVNNNFLELDSSQIAKILASSELRVAELEV